MGKMTHLSWTAAIANKDMSCSEASARDVSKNKMKNS